ncbi:succinate dehydrogenase cytochrome b subunit [uncultured Cytophaga sp.]|uniref:succinate dehydrogenase cytochrome b subunit n=1 Tax=uncultured Cytophaga sp. TaxID=160238 RepID=UPI002620CB5A|nr:succinate dehydrogenase cytochrome b subunit [uncultured Cytophaga sp.]
MSWFTKTVFSTSVGRKVIMALTGLFLCTFLAVHLAGNFQLLHQDGGEAFNLYTKFMTSNPLIKAISYVNFAFILAHVVWGAYITYKNKSARSVGYAVNNPGKTSSFSSRWMGVLGTMILIFLVIHLKDFKMAYLGITKDLPMVTYTLENDEKVIVKDMFSEVNLEFHEPIVVGIYVIGMIALGFHLFHGFQSAFQSLGLRHPKYTPIIKTVGFVFWGLIPFGFAIIPLIIFFR